MRLSLRTARRLVAAFTLLACGLASDAASAAPQGLPERHLDLELKEADVTNVLHLLADVSERKITLDPCVHGKVDLKLKNVPIALVYDALAMKLGLVYEEEQGVIKVGCAVDGGASNARGTARVSIAEKESPLPDVLDRLATSAKLEGVDYRASARPKVNVTLEGVRISTALTVLGDATGLKIAIANKRLVVTEQ
jgi:hypothetical protein